MTEQYPSVIGTVAQEAARLIEDMATMARSGSSRGEDPTTRYAGGPAQEPRSPGVPPVPGAGADYEAEDFEAEDFEAEDFAAQDFKREDYPAGGFETTDHRFAGVCSVCGAGRDEHTDEIGESGRDDTPSTCKLCPLCRAIALLRSVRPETVDLLADLATSMAASLRDVAARSRESDPRSSARSSSRSSNGPGRSGVQDIPVGDEGEG